MAAGQSKAAGAAEQSVLAMTAIYIVLWYALNIGYNIYNKKTCNEFPFPWTVGTISLGVGMLYVVPLWATGLRNTPKLEASDMPTLAFVGALHATGHFGAVVSMSLGAVSFTHIVKAAEPVFSTILSGIIMGSWSPWQVNSTLIPIVFGVAMASMKELTFTWGALIGAMVSNLAFALRSIYFKQFLQQKKAEGKVEGANLTAANCYAIYTMIAFVLSIPIAVFMEGSQLVSGWSDITKTISELDIAKLNVLTGAFFFLYNESQSLALGNLNPVAHAVCNTVKRVVIMAATTVYFNKPMSTQTQIGSGIAIGGTLLYALVKNRMSSAPKKKEA